LLITIKQVLRPMELSDFYKRYVMLIALFATALGVNSCKPAAKKIAKQVPVAGKSWNLLLPGKTQVPMNWVGPGSFVMGSPEAEHGRKGDESPQTTVTLTKGYWLGTTEVTIGEWKAVTGMSLREKVNKMLNDDSLYDFEGKRQKIRDYMHFDKNTPDIIMANEDERLPIYFVSWNEAMGFCRKLTSLERAKGTLPAGYEYTLPTEAQWEYACRAGSMGATFALSANANTTDEKLNDIAWYVKNSAIGYTGRGLGTPVAGPRNSGTKQPNKLGFKDMLGNIWEWCLDWYAPYPGGSITDPAGPSSGSSRVNRGGSWGSGINDERSANRAKNPPNEDSAYRGFRIALCAVRQ
jgi:formylglycine-generating enzyme required for sulfatase activity